MAVFTPVSEDELAHFLKAYDLGALRGHEGVVAGAENTNYRISADAGVFILTLFERRAKEADLPYFVALTAHLAKKGLPVPRPVRRRDGGHIGRIAGKPALLVTFLSGAPVEAPDADHCRAAGGMLARLHLGAGDFPIARENDLAVAGLEALARKCLPYAELAAPGLASFIEEETRGAPALWPRRARSGAVHGDYFPDNVFFENDAVSGVIDFYFACTDAFVFDIAVALNSWAARDGAWSFERASALLAGYESRRALDADERALLPGALRVAALRFLLTRLHDWLNRIDGARVNVKDPLEFRDILLVHRDSAPDSLYALAP